MEETKKNWQVPSLRESSTPTRGAADRFAHSAGPGNLELRDDLDVWDIWDILDVEDVQDVLDVFDNIMET